MSDMNNVLLKHFTAPHLSPLFSSPQLIGSLQGTSFRFMQYGQDGSRMRVIDERLYLLQTLDSVWQNTLLPASASAALDDDLKKVVKYMWHSLSSLPLVSSSPEFAALATAFASSVTQARPGDDIEPDELPLLKEPVSRLPVWDTTNPMALWGDVEGEEYLVGLLSSQRRSFVFDIIEEIERHPLASVLLNAVNALLKENINVYNALRAELVEKGYANAAQRNAAFAFEAFNLTSAQTTALNFVVSVASPLEGAWKHGEKLVDALVPAFKSKCDLFDKVLNIPTGTMYGLLKDGGVLHTAKWLNTMRGDKVTDLVKCLKPNVATALQSFSSTPQEFFAALTSDDLKVMDTATALPSDAFDYLGQDAKNFQLALSSGKPFKVLLAGKPGAGKSALIAAALAATNTTGVTIDDKSGYELSSDVITDVRNSMKAMGNPVLVIDPMDSLLNEKVQLNTMLNSYSSKQTTSPEVWVISDTKLMPAELMGAFDLVVELPALPLAQRKALAQKLFNDDALADKISKACVTPGEIVKLHEWSQASGQRDWPSLSIKAMGVQQATLKAGTANSELPLTLYQPSENKQGFESVVGNEFAVKEARKAIVGFRNPERFRVLNTTPPRGLLLTGAPGTGKTHLARAMAHEGGVPLLTASSSALANNPALITAVFAEARRQAPCILFLDEIDAIGATAENQNGASADPQRQSILNRLLVELSGFDDLENVMVMGATHRPHVLDEALTRSGRLGWKIHFDMPNRDAREEMWAYYTKNLAVDNVSLPRLARLSSGMSPADICETVKVASVEAAIEGQEAVTMDNFIKSIDAVLWGEAATNRKVLAKDLFETAVHEAGHALLAWAYGMDIDRVSVKPTRNALGYVRHVRDEDKLSYSVEDMEHQVSMLFGGLVAEEVVLGHRAIGASSDLEKVRAHIARLHREEGTGLLAGGVTWITASEQTKFQVEEQEAKHIEAIKKNTATILTSIKPVLRGLADQLVKNREMSGEELNRWLSEQNITPEALLSVSVEPTPINSEAPRAAARKPR